MCMLAWLTGLREDTSSCTLCSLSASLRLIWEEFVQHVELEYKLEELQ